MSEELKIGMYTTDEILEHLTEGEGRGFLGRSMYDAIIDYITNLQEENERLKERENKLQEKFKDWKKGIEKERKYYLCERTDCCGRIKDSKKYDSVYKENKRLNNIINELEKYINEKYIYDDIGMKIFDASTLQDKLQELKGSE